MDFDQRAEEMLEAYGKELALAVAEYMEPQPVKILPFHKRPFFTKLQRAIVAVLIVGVCLTGFVPEVRAAVVRGINYIIEAFSDHIRFTPNSGPYSPDENWSPYFELSYIPLDLSYFDTTESESFVMEQFLTKDETRGFLFSQNDSTLYSISVDNETTIHEITEVHGLEAHLFYELYPDVPDELDSPCYNVLLIWQDGSTVLELNGVNMSREEILRIAEGVRRM